VPGRRLCSSRSTSCSAPHDGGLARQRLCTTASSLAVLWQVIYKDSWAFQLLFALIYGTVMGVTLTAQSWRRERERERREAELTILAREAELGAIRAQFQHFVLNALNSLLALIDRDPALA
jgi:hypothetical protein